MTDLKKNIEQSLELLFKVEEQPSKKKLLVSKPKTIYLQIVLFRIPFVRSPIKKYLNLRHSLHGDEPEICLFVPNRKTGVEYKKTTDELIDFCVDYYTELLEKHKIKGISTIMPLKQLRSEYGSYELRRKLVRRYDLFLCKNSLLFNPRFLTALGKIFTDASREPLGVTFPKEDSDYDPAFQKSIDKAIFASSFVIKRASDNYTIPIGTLSNTKSELRENLETVLDQLISGKMIPGGAQNVRMLNLWPSQSKPIPLFINPELPLEDKNPRVKNTRRKRKMPIGVEGEISTQPGKKVVVMPNGEVFVTSIQNKKQEIESESDDSFDDGSEAEDEEELRRNVKSKQATEKDEEKSESEDDEEIEEREQRLLREKRKAEDGTFGKHKSIKAEEDEEAESTEEELEIPKKKKMEKTRKGKNVTKSNRKMLMKQEKLKIKEKKKSKQKKV